jgi:hypothetical protein
MKTAEAMSTKHGQGRVTIQHGAGTVKVRKFEIQPL